MWNGDGGKGKCQTKISLPLLHFFPIKKENIDTVIKDVWNMSVLTKTTIILARVFLYVL